MSEERHWIGISFSALGSGHPARRYRKVGAGNRPWSGHFDGSGLPLPLALACRGGHQLLLGTTV